MNYTSSGTIANDGWNLVGNPFPSTIDWNSASGWTKTNIDASIYIRDNGSTNTQVAAWNGVVGTNGGSSRIAMGQGFWVKANGSGTPVLRANENVKAAGSQTTFFKKGSPEDVLRVAMVSGTTRDEAVIHFRSDATENFDTNADALKLPNTLFNLSSVMADGKVLAINSLPLFSCNSTVKLNIANADAGSYTLDFSDYESFPAAVQITLVDNFTNSTINIRDKKSYSFAVTAKQESYGSNRFAVTFSYPTVSSSFVASAKDVCSNTSAIVDVQNSQANITYTAQVKNTTTTSAGVAGTGSSIKLSIPQAGLSTGADTILIKAVGNGCSPDVVKTIVLNVAARAEIASVTNGKQCTQGQVTLQATGAPDNGSYRWYESGTATAAIGSAQGASYTTPALTQSKTYYVSAVSALGCEGTRKPVVAEIVTLEEAVIMENGDSLISNYATGNQWYFNNAIIANATTQSVKIEHTSGIYRVDVTYNGCTTSAERELIVAGIEHGEASVTLYPNPVVKELHVEVPGNLNVTAFRLLNVSGQQVGTLELQQSSGKRLGIFDMRNYPAGVYILQSTDAASVIETKIVKN
ncbi:MAG TPA: T9SS type A sorting domain-containing protein, partial [Ohtaekwangia sp.]|uniref:Ig-like domain-containing protein n=1 Tax=Ohtaekwangia sp. TaxID=2066019 RepID=UPI002F935503